MHKKGIKYDVRPLTARSLKSIRDTLRADFDNARVLDLYCGKGRFGITALEQQCEHATFVDNNPAVIHPLKEELGKFGIKATLLAKDALNYLNSSPEAVFDIIFADPPYPMWNSKFVKSLTTAVLPHLGPESIFLVKHPKGVVPSDHIELNRWKHSLFGETEISYYLYEPTR